MIILEILQLIEVQGCTYAPAQTVAFDDLTAEQILNDSTGAVSTATVFVEHIDHSAPVAG